MFTFVNQLIHIINLIIFVKNVYAFFTYSLGWFKILILGSWDIYTSHLICTTLMSISSYLDDLIMHFPLRASHRKFSGTVGVIENRTLLNPPPSWVSIDDHLLTLIAAMYDKWGQNMI